MDVGAFKYEIRVQTNQLVEIETTTIELDHGLFSTTIRSGQIVVRYRVSGENQFWLLNDMRNLSVDLIRDCLMERDIATIIVNEERIALWNA